MAKRPNIILFNPDQWRGDVLGHMGNPGAMTPNLDVLVKADAVSFGQAFCQNPVCTPSRCSFMTGWYPHTRGHRTMFHMLQPDEPNLLRRLKDAGYFVWWGGKNDLVAAQYGFAEHCDVKYVPPVDPQRPLRTVFHHHCAGYVEHPTEIDTLMRLTDPDLLGLCFDTGHFRFGGGDPVQGLHTYKDRIWHVHFKDCDPQVAERSRAEQWDYFHSIRNGIFCELGRGDVDFARIQSELKENGYDGWIVVEQDVLPGLGEPKESAQRNRDYLSSIGLRPNLLES